MTAAIISALEKASEGSRELDAMIARERGCIVIRDEHGYYIDKVCGAENMPHYTTSLDAALTLVPEGDFDQHWTRTTRGAAEGFKLWQVRICLETVEQDPDETGPQEIGEAPTPALAMCIAALKAQQSRRPA